MQRKMLIRILLLIGILTVFVDLEIFTVWAACQREEAVHLEVKKSAPKALRSRVYFYKTALSMASLVDSKLAENAGTDKAVFYEMNNGTSPSVFFFRNNCRITEVKVPDHVYRLILYLRGEYPGIQVV